MLPNLDSLSSVFGALDGMSAAFVTGFVVALLEAFVFTTLATPGCLATVGMGVMMAYGRIHPVGCVAGVAVGMWLGGQCSYLIVRCGRERFNRLKIGKRVLVHTGDLGRSPARTLILAHLCPYLSGLAPAAAAVAPVPYARFLCYDTFGVIVGTAWFLGVGASLGASSQAFAKGLVVGVGLTVLGLVICIVLYRAMRSSLRRRGLTFMLLGLFEYPVFLLQGVAYRFLPPCKKRVLKAHRDAIAGQAQPGDILLVTRDSGGPWGKASHAALFETGDTLIHAFHSVRRERLAALPLRDGFRLLRVDLTAEQRQAVLAYARKQIGKRFRIATTLAHIRQPHPRHFSCASLVWASFNSAGVDLAAHTHTANRWVFPSDFLSSPLTVEVPIAKSECGCSASVTCRLPAYSK